MRWEITKKNEPKEGDKRIISEFLIFPLTLGNEKRWLEKAKIEQIYTYNGSMYVQDTYYSWDYVRFID